MLTVVLEDKLLVGMVLAQSSDTSVGVVEGTRGKEVVRNDDEGRDKRNGEAWSRLYKWNWNEI